jgi:hypothetical protein
MKKKPNQKTFKKLVVYSDYSDCFIEGEEGFIFDSISKIQESLDKDNTSISCDEELDKLIVYEITQIPKSIVKKYAIV